MERTATGGNVLTKKDAVIGTMVAVAMCTTFTQLSSGLSLITLLLGLVVIPLLTVFASPDAAWARMNAMEERVQWSERTASMPAAR